MRRCISAAATARPSFWSKRPAPRSARAPCSNCATAAAPRSSWPIPTRGEWSFGAGTNFILKQGAVGSASNAKTKLFEVTDTGNAILTGTLTTGGTTCGGGCDAVFEPDYPLPSIADHAAQMRALGYLPNVGPTPEGAPFDLTDKLGRMLNELEHAHLYIAQQDARIARLEAQLATVLAGKD
ncbi:MAG: hypothetical protein R3D85_02175 [Paracoccaceae bacterium]